MRAGSKTEPSCTCHGGSGLQARAVAWSLALLLGVWSFGIFAQAQKQARQQAATPQKQESFTRPKPTAAQKPTIPSANRFRPDKVFLEQADSLVRRGRDTVDRQMVTGDVRFRQGGMWMYCDSAYYYPERNSMDAFGHVRMQQGDTLFVYADKLYYDGTQRYARLYRGPSQSKVILRDSRGELETDTLYYDVAQEVGSYNRGGVLRDEVNTLKSVYGEYSPRSHDAFFEFDVSLVNHRDDYRLYSERLRYNTETNIARIETPTRIYGATDSIVTSAGWYNTASDNLELTSRSTVFHRDSLGRVTTLTGDSIVYDRPTRITQIFAFADPGRRGMMEITDTARKVVLTGYEGWYNDSTREAYATIYPLLTDYSREQPLFLRADTIYSRVYTLEDTDVSDSVMTPETVDLPDSTGTSKEYHYAKAFPRARFFNEQVQGVAADSMVYHESDSLVRFYGRPIIWSGERQVTGPIIMVHLNDTTADRADLPKGGMMSEWIEEDFYDQLSGKNMIAHLANRTLERLEVYQNVETIFLPQESDSTYNRLVNAMGDSLVIDMAEGDLRHLRLWPSVSGSVIPLFMVKEAQKHLPKFVWYGDLRPRREVDEEGTLRWGDDFGEIPEPLEEYFSRPSDPADRPKMVTPLPAATQNP